MAAAKNQKVKTSKKVGSNNAVQAAEADKAEKRRVVGLVLDPSASGMATILAFSKGTFGEADEQSLYEATRAKVLAVRDGNMNGPEALLVAQANSLHMIYTELARRSAANMGEYIEPAERYMRLALKAQAQCRATIETLAALKNPPIVYARQANISGGHQQVNNYSGTAEASPAGKTEDPPSELLEDK